MKFLLLSALIALAIINNHIVVAEPDPNCPFTKSGDQTELTDCQNTGLKWSITLTLDENIGIDYEIGILDVDGVTLGSTDYFKATSESSKTKLTTIRDVDYEKITQLIFSATKLNIVYDFFVNVNNLNDNPIMISGATCAQDENNAAGTVNNDCKFFISDADGLSETLHFDFKPKGRFQMDIVEAELKDKKEAELHLKFLIAEDYEKESNVVLYWYAWDDEYYKNDPKEELSVVIKINDLNDEKPVWRSLFGTINIDELEDIVKELDAYDGDISLNYRIRYDLVCKNNDKCGKISIGGADKNILKIEAIDLKDPSKNSVEFQILAIEDDDRDDLHYWTPQDVYLQIKDINNNAPKITLNENEITLVEHFSGTVENATFSIEDKDSGPFGTYTVNLQLNHSFNEVMRVIPNSGYQKMDFSIIVSDPEQLDYDEMVDPTIEVTIVAYDNEHTETEIIKIIIKDQNDEIPVWKETNGEYEVTIEETFGRKSSESLKIDSDFFAEDEDKEEIFNAITYELIGITAKNLFDLQQPNKGENVILNTKLKVAPAQLFDFERENPVVIVVEACDCNDQATAHKVTTQLTIILEDVNDELPTLTANLQTIDINEEEIIDNIDITLIGADADSDSELTLTIVEDESYCLKQGKKVNWAECKCIDILQTSPGNQKTVEGTILFTSGKAPSYEKIDTIYLQTQVEDIKAIEPNPQESKLQLVINIINIPNIPLEFNDDSFNSISVVEHDQLERFIGVIQVTDREIPNDWGPIKFTLEPIGSTPEDFIVFEHEESGRLIVNADIDADIDSTPKVLKYTVTAADTEPTRTSQNVLEIEVKDTNDKPPVPNPKTANCVIDEHESEHKKISIVTVTDDDRDAENQNFKCNPVSRQEYEIETSENACIINLKDGSEIDRDCKDCPVQHTFEFVIVNEASISTGLIQSATVNVIVNIKDINDNAPGIVENLVITTDEQKTKDTELDKVQGIDNDIDPENSDITFKVVQVTKLTFDDTPRLTEEDFNCDEKSGTKDCILKANVGLKNKYGTYTIKFSAENVNELVEGTAEATNLEITLIVEKFNFEAPTFIFPEDNERLLLSIDSQPGNQLVTRSGTKLRNFEATDNQNDKYSVKMELCDVEGNVIDDEYFKLIPQNDGTTQLQLKGNQPTGLETFYMIATNYDGVNPAEPLLTSIIKVEVVFMEENAQPVFNPNEFTCHAKEEELGMLNCPDMPEATEFYLLKSRDADSIKYSLDGSKTIPPDAYEVPDPNKLEVNIIKKLDIVELEEGLTSFIIQAYTGTEPPPNANAQSLLTVTVILEDINNHAPVFPADSTKLGYLLIGPTPSPSMFLTAYDPDVNDKLSYNIDEGSYKVSDSSLPAFSTEPFLLITEGRRAELKPNFTVQSTMSGLIEFDIIVVDDDVTHTDSAHMEMFVISDRHLCTITFENALKQVEDSKTFVIAVLEEHFEYKVGVSSFRNQELENENSITVSEVIAYFIDYDNKIGIENEDIKSRINNFNFYAELRKAFLEEGLVLKNVYVQADAESKEEAYKIALIVVSAVFGLLLIALIGFFTYKLRSKNNILHRMNQTEARRPTVVANLPGANRRATQVVNPNISMYDNDEDAISNDLSFTKSPRHSKVESLDDDDSDDENFIGVENSDIFKISGNQ